MPLSVEDIDEQPVEISRPGKSSKGRKIRAFMVTPSQPPRTMPIGGRLVKGRYGDTLNHYARRTIGT
jgi:hypothetical protein